LPGIAVVLLLSAGAGYMAARLKPVQTVVAQDAQSVRPMPPDIPPVPNPPLYPYPPDRVRFWSFKELQQNYQKYVAAAKANPENPRYPNGAPRDEGAVWRTRYVKPRPSNRKGEMSDTDDADQHEGHAHFVIVLGAPATAEFLTDGTITDRIYGRAPSTFEG